MEFSRCALRYFVKLKKSNFARYQSVANPAFTLSQSVTISDFMRYKAIQVENIFFCALGNPVNRPNIYATTDPTSWNVNAVNCSQQNLEDPRQILHKYVHILRWR